MHLRPRARLFSFLLAATLGPGLRPLASSAPTGEPALLTLERIFKAKEFEPERFGPARWREGGTAYTTLEPPAAAAPTVDSAGVLEIVRYDTASGRREVMVSAARLTPPGASPLPIADYSWSRTRST